MTTKGLKSPDDGDEDNGQSLPDSPARGDSKWGRQALFRPTGEFLKTLISALERAL